MGAHLERTSGCALDKGALESDGYKIVGEEVRIKTPFGDRVIDLIAEYKGKYYAIEVKNGPYTRQTFWRKIKDGWLNQAPREIRLPTGDVVTLEGASTVYVDVP